MDILWYLLTNWKWYVLALIVCLAFAYNKYIRAPRTYYSSIDVLINDPSKSEGVVGLGRYSSVFNSVNISNELHMLRSKELLEKMVRNTHADMSYTIRVQLYQGDMYGREPVNITFLDSAQVGSVSFTMHIKDTLHCVLSEFYEGSPKLEVPFDKVVKTPAGRLLVTLTDKFDDTWIDLETHITKMPVESVVRYYHNALSIRQGDEEASILKLALQDASYQRAQAVLRGLIDVYNADARASKQQIAVKTAEFVNERIEVIGKELGGVANEMADFKRENRLLSPSDAAQRYMGEVYATEDQQYDKEVQLRMAQALMEYLINPMNQNELIPVNIGLEESGLEAQITKINALKQEYDRLGGATNEGNPIVKELQENIKTQRGVLITLLDNYMGFLRTQRSNIISRGKRADAKMGAMPEKESEIQSIERQQKIKDALYTFLLNKREENAISQAMVTDNARIIDSSDGDEVPISPSRTKILFLGLLAGLLIPSLILLARLFLDTKVRTRRDLEGVLTVPFLGEVPFDKTMSVENAFQQDCDQSGQHKIVTEAIRVLRTNIAFMNKEKEGAQVIMLTSFHEHSGKTFITANLAKSLAQAEQRVLVIDLDIRKRSMTMLHHIHNQIGASDFLAGKMSVDAIIVKGDVGMPDFIPAGHVAPNPSELL